jgi:lysophospholipase L1-like esterase
MGWGVGDGQSYESLVEDRLNRDDITSGAYLRYEILNFSIAGYGPLEQLWLLETRAFDFSPDAIFFVGYSHDATRTVENLARVLWEHVDIPYDFVVETITKAGLVQSTQRALFEYRLRPYGLDIVGSAYRRLEEECRQRGIKPYFLLIPKVGEVPGNEPGVGTIRRLAGEAGLTVLDLTDAFQNSDDQTQLVMARWDMHPNAKGHQLLADRLFDKLTEHEPFLNRKPLAFDQIRTGGGN